MRRINLILVIALCSMSTQADICNIAGFIFDDRGPVADGVLVTITNNCLLYTSPSPRDS